MMRDASEVDEPITMTAYDPLWPALFELESARVMRALGGIATRVEHFGSTAVSGMAGKPIIDLLVGVQELQKAADRVELLAALGYENFGEIFIPGRLYLRRRGPPHFNAAVTRHGGEFWNTQIILRDFLRTHPAEAAGYPAIKRSAYEGGARLFSTYSQTKGPFLDALKVRAEKWHDQGRSGRPTS
jgi:GrpB-like predicted nucleotidyltransferase (UPF0157 family)